MRTRIYFADEGQDMQYLDVDIETGKICNVNPECSPSDANIYIGGIVDVSAVQEGKRLSICDVNNGGKLFSSRYYVADKELL